MAALYVSYQGTTGDRQFTGFITLGHRAAPRTHAEVRGVINRICEVEGLDRAVPIWWQELPDERCGDGQSAKDTKCKP